MKDLLNIAGKYSNEAEVFSTNGESLSIQYSAGKLHEIESSFQSGSSIRLIKDRNLGFAYTKNIIDPESFVKNAVTSLEGKVAAEYSFPYTKDVIELNGFDPSIDDLTSTQIVHECERVLEKLNGKTNAEIHIYAGKGTGELAIANTHGTDLCEKGSSYYMMIELGIPGSGSGISRTFVKKAFEPMPDAILDELVMLFKHTNKVVTPDGGKMKVLFMPGCMYALTWRLSSGTSGRSRYQKISPISEKIGEQLLSPKMTIYNDPLDVNSEDARSFDDEGVATSKLMLFENGVLKNLYYDLNYAKKFGTQSTGNGYRTGMWGGDAIKMTPGPSLKHLRFATGDKSFKELISMIDKGIILEGAMGAHSGNIPNGDYSVGVSPALYVEKGEIVGLLKDTMVAGNVYETLSDVVAIEDRLNYSWGGMFPSVLCDNVSVSIKK